MQRFLSSPKNLILDILFPAFCINCSKEGSYLCPDCFSLTDILNRQYCPFCECPKVVLDGKSCNRCKRSKNLNGLYCATSYDNFIVKKLINQFKYEPYLKELSKPLSSLIIAHLINLNKFTPLDNKHLTEFKEFSNFLVISVPLHKKKLKQRGFNQAEELAKELSKNLKIPVICNVLVKIKQTPSQVELMKEEREKNIKGAFSCQNPELINRREILLVDDVFTTGSTLEECARVLKDAGAKEVWGIVVARG